METSSVHCKDEHEGTSCEEYSHSGFLFRTLGIALLLFFFFAASEVILILFAAVLLAVFLRSLSDRLAQRLHLSQTLSLFAVVLLLAATTGILFWLIAPSVAEQIDRLTAKLPSIYSWYNNLLEKYEWIQNLFPTVSAQDDIIAKMSGILGRIARFFSGTADFFINTILIIVVGLYLATESDRYINGLVILFPLSWRARTREVLGVMGSTIRGWLLGQLTSMTFLGIFTYVGLMLMGIPLALTLALFTALLTFIPNLGPIISVIPPILIALTVSPLKAIYVLLFYIALQNVEGYFMTPMVMRHAIRLPPALLILAQILLALLLGFFGLILAAPMVAIVIVLAKLLYLEDTLGEKVSIPGYEGKS
jgi:predicted PurR-regulated permease PerM